MDYLHRRGAFADAERFPPPSLILLDLNMPRKNGREALVEIKSDPELRKIPVVVLSTSHSDEDIERSYRDGVNSFITKPSSFAGFLDVVRTLGRYWLDIVELPPTRDDYRAVQVEIPHFADFIEALHERQIDFEWQKGVLPGIELAFLQDPAGYWVSVGPIRKVM